jgi:lipopolysaccharide transport system permease protein
MVYFSIDPSPLLLLAPLFVLLAFVLAASIGTLFAALNVRFRDVKFALPFLVQVWMIASPIFYPMGIIPERWRLIFAINPLTGILEGFRCSLFGVQCDWPAIAVSTTTVAAIALFSLFVFKRMEDDFADVI